MDSPILTLGQLGSAEQPTILLVEDDIDTRWTTAENLRCASFRVLEAGNVAEALVLLGTHSEVDLVFSDINMPGLDDGYALARWCRQHRPGLPVILTSGRPEDSTAYVRDRLSIFLQKPCEPTHLVEIIRQLLGETKRGTMPAP